MNGNGHATMHGTSAVTRNLKLRAWDYQVDGCHQIARSESGGHL